MRKLFLVLAGILIFSTWGYAVPTQYIQLRSNLQPGSTFYVSSGTVTQINISSITVQGNFGYVLLYSSTVYGVADASATAVASYVPTLTKITLTPKRSTSRIEISWSGMLNTTNGAVANAFASIFRGTTNLAPGNGDMCVVNANASAVKGQCAGDIIDVPNTTSATTYTVYIRTDAAGTAVGWNNSSGVGVASITVKEWSY